MNYLLLKNDTARTSSIRIFFRAGSVNDTDQKQGLAHVVEHVLCDPSGGYYEFDAETYKEYLVFSSEQLPQDTGEVLEKLWSKLNAPISYLRFRKEKEVIHTELLQHPPDLTLQTAMEVLFGNTPLMYSSGGYNEQVIDLTLNDVATFRDNYLTPDNCKVVITGNFDQATIEPFLAQNLTQTRTSPSPSSAQIPRGCIVRDKDSDLETINFFYSLFSRSEYLAQPQISILINMLIGSSSALLNQLLRKNFGVYSLAEQTEYYSECGFFNFGFFINPNRTDEAIGVLENMFANIKKHLTNELFERAKQRTLFEWQRWLSDPSAISWWHGENLIIANRSCDIETDLFPALEKTTLEDIHALAQKYLTTQPTYIDPATGSAH